MEFQVDESGQIQGVQTEHSKELLEFLESLKKTDTQKHNHFEEINHNLQDSSNSDEDSD